MFPGLGIAFGPFFYDRLSGWSYPPSPLPQHWMLRVGGLKGCTFLGYLVYPTPTITRTPNRASVYSIPGKGKGNPSHSKRLQRTWESAQLTETLVADGLRKWKAVLCWMLLATVEA